MPNNPSPHNRGRNLLLGAGLIVIVLVAVFFVPKPDSSPQALSARLAAEAQSALDRDDTTLGLLLSARALDAAPQPSAPVLAAAWRSLGAAGTGLLEGHANTVLAAAVSADSRWLLTGSDDKSARLWDLTAPDPAARPIVLPDLGGSVFAVAFSPDQHWAVTGSGWPDNGVRLWDLTAPDPAAHPVLLKGHEDSVSVLTVSPDGHWLV